MKQITDLEGNKLELVRGLYKIDESYDIDELHKQLEEFLTEQKQLEKQLEEDTEYKETLRPLYMEYHEKLAEIDEEKIQNDYEEYKELKSKLRDTESNIKIIESKIKSLLFFCSSSNSSSLLKMTVITLTISCSVISIYS